ncbi:MAG: polyketide cyclase [Marmoricola sp.]|nr:polyketide cyclase [Marmoricola sp.]
MELAQRIERLESREQIRNLVARYAVLIDSRDLDALVDLFTEDVRVTRETRGRDAMKSLIDGLVRQFTTSVHFVGAQTLDFVDNDHAEGVVYCKAEHEYGDEWIVMAIQYWDRYERRDGTWQFSGRRIQHWYATDLNDRPTGPAKTRWAVTGSETLPGAYASWGRFWATEQA